MATDSFGLSGHVIDGQFRVERVVGEGGFSVVYLARHLAIDEPVAIKCLKLSASLEPGLVDSFARRFRDETRIAYRLSQGNLDIVRSITGGTTRSPLSGATVPYMVLEWLEGISLGTNLRERRAKGMTGRSLEEVLALYEPAFLAVAHAHSQGIVHRDLKPGNLFLAKDRGGRGERLKVLDFGLAKIVDESSSGIVPSVKTIGHNTICSPSYGAPEQFDPGIGKIGPWTDVYALGLLVLEALRDRKVRTGEGLAQCALQALDPKQQPTCHALGIRVRPQVEVALARAVALDTSMRHADAAAFWEELKTAISRKKGTSPSSPDQRATAFDPHAGEGDPLASTRAGKALALPRDAFRSETNESGGLGGTLVMNDTARTAATRATVAAARAAAANERPALASPIPLAMGSEPSAARVATGSSPVVARVDAYASTRAAPHPGGSTHRMEGGPARPHSSHPAMQAARPTGPVAVQHHGQPGRSAPGNFAPGAGVISPRAYTHSSDRPLEVLRSHSSAPAPSGPRSSPPITQKRPRKKKSRAPLVLFILFLSFALLGGGGFALYRYVLVPRGIVAPIHL